ncbi:MAG: fimbrillin family protein, partial [Alistipes sp.]|nr:fimbrillin family protein [Alistipes sp.]
MRFKIYISILFVLSLVACTKDVDTIPAADAPVTVGFWVGDPQTRTSINSDGITTSWSKDDRVALWADLQIGANVYHRLYNKVEFDLLYRDRSTAMFTTEMAEVMPGDETTRYRYYATYPVPKSVDGNRATFSLPAQQDGKISNGAAIMVAIPDEAQPLRALKDAAATSTSNMIKEDHLRLKMQHMMHALKFYVPSNKWAFDEGEKIDRIVFTMPQTIAGDVTLDYTNPDFAVTTTNGVKEITLNLTQPIGPSESASNLDFAAASIIPSGHSFADGDQIVVKMYTENQAAINYISLKGRTQMQAGHITPIGLDCSDARYQYVLRFVWGGNN